MWFSLSRILSATEKQVGNKPDTQDYICPHTLWHVLEGKETKTLCERTGRSDLCIGLYTVLEGNPEDMAFKLKPEEEEAAMRSTEQAKGQRVLRLWQEQAWVRAVQETKAVCGEGLAFFFQYFFNAQHILWMHITWLGWCPLVSTKYVTDVPHHYIFYYRISNDIVKFLIWVYYNEFSLSIMRYLSPIS